MDVPAAAAKLGEFDLIDVRETREYDAGHIEGSRNIPMGQLSARIAEIDPERDLLVICRSGARSGVVTRLLNANGYKAKNLEGGLKAWVRHGLPSKAADGGPGQVA